MSYLKSEKAAFPFFVFACITFLRNIIWSSAFNSMLDHFSEKRGELRLSVMILYTAAALVFSISVTLLLKYLALKCSAYYAVPALCVLDPVFFSVNTDAFSLFVASAGVLCLWLALRFPHTALLITLTSLFCAIAPILNRQTVFAWVVPAIVFLNIMLLYREEKRRFLLVGSVPALLSTAAGLMINKRITGGTINRMLLREYEGGTTFLSPVILYTAIPFLAAAVVLLVMYYRADRNMSVARAGKGTDPRLVIGCAGLMWLLCAVYGVSHCNGISIGTINIMIPTLLLVAVAHNDAAAQKMLQAADALIRAHFPVAVAAAVGMEFVFIWALSVSKSNALIHEFTLNWN